MALTLSAELQRAFGSAADSVLFETGEGRRWSYREVDRLAGRIARRLAEAGAAPGERVVVQVDKSVAAVATYLACVRTGAAYVPLNPAYTPTEVASFVDDSDPVVVVCDPSRVGEHRIPVLSLDADGSGSLLDGLGAGPELPWVETDPESVAAMLNTSGTTGRSKGAMLSHRALLSNASTLCDQWGISADDVLVHALPIFHTHGLFVALHTLMLRGGTVRYLRRFDVDAVCAALAGATMMMGVPTYYMRLMSSEAFDPRTTDEMRLFVCLLYTSDAADDYFWV